MADEVPERYLAEIRRAAPGCRLDRARLAGGENADVVIVDDALVFRFPRHTAAVAQLEVEAAVLAALRGRLPLAIPDPIYRGHSTEVGRAFMGYPLLPGELLLREVLARVGDEAALQRVAEQLAAFLRALHSLPSATFPVALPLRGTHEEWLNRLAQVRRLLFPHMRPAARRRVDAEWSTYLADPASFAWESVPIHGDFGPTNILFDGQTGRVCGVIDFGSAGLGDTAADLAALIGPFGYGEEFLAGFAGAYPGVAALLGRARFYASTFALQEALFGAEHGDAAAFAAGMAPYR